MIEYIHLKRIAGYADDDEDDEQAGPLTEAA